MLSAVGGFEWVGPNNFDPFTPYRRLISIGGVRVHEGAWTSVEVLNSLKRDYPLTEESGTGITLHGGRYHAQFNSLRLSIETSLVAMSHSSIALIWIDMRYNAQWIESSVERAIKELRIWRAAHDRIKSVVPLEAIIWIESDDAGHSPLDLSTPLHQGLSRIERQCQLSRVTLLSVIRRTHDRLVADHAWRELKRVLTSEGMLMRAEEESLYKEMTPFLDELVFIPKGYFYQGGGQLSPRIERPRHRVKISQPFWVSQTAVTRGLWRAVMIDDEFDEDNDSSLKPISEVSWFDALRFCNRLSEVMGLEQAYEIEKHELPEVTFNPLNDGFRLLTESEWEYMSTGGAASSLTARPLTPPIAWTEQRSQLASHPVAQLEPNGWGLYDCLGNISEWCQDVFKPNVYENRQAQRVVTDPCEYLGDGGERVIKGGAFDSPEYTVTLSRREGCRPQQSWSTVGFRIARSAQTERANDTRTDDK